MIEHGSVSFLDPLYDVAEVSHDQYFKFVKAKFGKLRVEVLQKWRQLIIHEIIIDQHNLFRIGIILELQVIWRIEGPTSRYDNSHWYFDSLEVIISLLEIYEVDVRQSIIAFRTAKTNGFVIALVTPELW